MLVEFYYSPVAHSLDSPPSSDEETIRTMQIEKTLAPKTESSISLPVASVLGSLVLRFVLQTGGLRSPPKSQAHCATAGQLSTTARTTPSSFTT